MPKSLDGAIEAMERVSGDVDIWVEDLFCQGCDTADSHAVNLRGVLTREHLQKLLEAALPHLGLRTQEDVNKIIERLLHYKTSFKASQRRIDEALQEIKRVISHADMILARGVFDDQTQGQRVVAQSVKRILAGEAE